MTSPELPRITRLSSPRTAQTCLPPEQRIVRFLEDSRIPPIRPLQEPARRAASTARYSASGTSLMSYSDGSTP